MAKYDPDGDPRKFNPTDPEAVDAWLSDPVVEALHEDLGRAFRAQPAAEQLKELEPELVNAEARHEETLAMVADLPDDDVRRRLLKGSSDYLDGLKLRIMELREQL